MPENKQTDIYQTLAKVRAKYSDEDDLQRIDSDHKHIKDLLKLKDLAENEAMQELLAVCRKEIVYAKRKLATDKSLIGDEKAQLELWFIVEAREWFVKIISRDFDGELASIQSELLTELER